MGQPVLDRNARRLERSVLRANGNGVVQTMYGTSDYRQAMVLRLRQLARQARSGDIPGDVIYDVEPVEFDDLIEIRTGGDKALTADVDLQRFGARWVSYWPLAQHTADDTMGGWEQAIQNTAERRHYMVVETDSLIEQFLTFDMGYRAFGRDDMNERYRMMTSDRFVEELREAQRQYLADVGLATRPRRRRATYYDASTLQVITPPSVLAQEQIRPLYRNDGSLPVGRLMEEPEGTYQFINTSSTTTWVPGRPSWSVEPERPADDDAPEEWDADAWVEDHYMTAADGRRVRVNDVGLDANGVNPRTPGYYTGACNCDECMEQRADDSSEDDEPYEDTEGDYEEDEG